MRQLILLHGALGSKRQMEPLKKTLESDFEVHAFSFEGHGDVATDRPLRIAHFSENLRKYITENGLEQPEVFGYSMGGYVALYTEALFPGTFARITTLGSKFHWNPDVAAREVRMLQPEIIEEKVPKFAAHLEAIHSPTDWKTNMRATAEMMEAMGDNPPMDVVDLTQIVCPVTLCLGTEDTMVTEGETMLIQSQIPKAVFERLEKVVHPLEKVDLALIQSVLV